MAAGRAGNPGAGAPERLAAGLKVDWLGMALIGLALGSREIVLDKGQREDWFQSSFITSFMMPVTAQLSNFVQPKYLMANGMLIWR